MQGTDLVSPAFPSPAGAGTPSDAMAPAGCVTPSLSPEAAFMAKVLLRLIADISLKQIDAIHRPYFLRKLLRMVGLPTAGPSHTSCWLLSDLYGTPDGEDYRASTLDPP